MFCRSRCPILFLPALASLLYACSGETASTTNQFGYPPSSAGPGGATATASSTDSTTGETTSNSSTSSIFQRRVKLLLGEADALTNMVHALLVGESKE